MLKKYQKIDKLIKISTWFKSFWNKRNLQKNKFGVKERNSANELPGVSGYFMNIRRNSFD